MNWIRIAALVMAVGAVGGADARREPNRIALTASDDGEVYRVPVGAEFEVRLTQAVGADWGWEMRDDPRFIAVHPPWRSAYGHDRGDREDITFTVRVTQPGRATLVFEKLSTSGRRDRSLADRVAYAIEATGADGDLDGQGPVPVTPVGPPIILTDKDAERRIPIAPGGTVVIRLPFASRLEERWSVLGSVNMGLVDTPREERDFGRKKNIFWLDSNNVFQLRPLGRGKAEVTFTYLPRPRDGTAARQLRYRFTVD